MPVFTLANISKHVSEKYDTTGLDVPAEGKQIIDKNTLKRIRYDEKPENFNLKKLLAGKRFVLLFLPLQPQLTFE